MKVSSVQPFSGRMAIGFICALLLADSAAAQQPPGRRGIGAQARRSPAEREQAEQPKHEATSAPKKANEYVAIVGGDIITVARETIRGGSILIEDGKITQLGQRVEIPETAKRIDATGKTITPGFIAIEMSGVGLSSGSDSATYADSLDPFDRNISLSLAVGITAGCIELRDRGGIGRRGRDEDYPITERFLGFDPDEMELAAYDESKSDFGEYVSLCQCCGLPILPTEPITNEPPAAITPSKSAVIKMSFGKLDGMLVTASPFLDLTPGSLSGSLNQHTWRDQISKARKYLEDQAEHEKATAAGKRQTPPRKPVSDEMLRLVKREIPLRIPANTVSDIRDMISLAKELDYRLVISGANEAWVIPQELAEAGVKVIMTPRTRRQPRFGMESTTGTWIEMPRVLEKTGVPFALSTLSNSISLNGLAGRDLTSLPLEAAFAVRGGASDRAALAALTIAPATMLGLEKRIGTIEVGKDADLLVLDGDPLDYRTYVRYALVDGRLVYQRDVDRVLPDTES
jgi:imidazolonepropionase-like amidohydrolase